MSEQTHHGTVQMKCLFPLRTIHKGTNLPITHKCGQCTNCRITRAQEWTLRMLLESQCHDNSVFVTLTYAQRPENNSLSKTDCQLFMKRLRETVYRKHQSRFRYFIVGEYGPKTHRPHYHAILFGFHVEHIELISAAWQHGYISVSDLTRGRASYCAKYCLKKHTQPEAFPDGRMPEFSLMSRNPGIGALRIPALAAALGDHEHDNIIRIDQKTWPIDTYLRDKIREYRGQPKPSATVAAIHNNFQSGLQLRERLAQVESDPLTIDLPNRQEKQGRHAKQRKLQGTL